MKTSARVYLREIARILELDCKRKFSKEISIASGMSKEDVEEMAKKDYDLGFIYEVSVRSAETRDLEDVGKLHDRYFGGGYFYRDCMEDENNSILVAEHDGALIGYISVEKNIICRMAVADDLRSWIGSKSGKSVGKILVMCAMKATKEQGYKQILATEVGVEGAYLFQSMGFEQVRNESRRIEGLEFRYRFR